MYGFVEKDLADILVQEGVIDSYEPFSTADGSQVALLERDQFNLVKDVISVITGGDRVCVIQSDVNGIYILFHPFWMAEELFDALTPGNVKESPLYLDIRTEPSASRFNWTDFKNAFRSKLRIMIDVDPVENETTDDNNAIYNEAGTGTIEVPEEAPAPPPPQDSEEVKFMKRLRYDYSLEFRITHRDDGPDLWYSLDSPINSIDVENMAIKFNKHVVVTGGHKVWKDRIGQILKSFPKEVNDKIIFIYPYPSHEKLYVPVSKMTHTIFGLDSPVVYQLHADDVRHFNANNSPALGAAFSDFDYVYRDYKTGVIWALQKANHVYFTLEILQTTPTLYAALINELIDRFEMALPYDEMVRRDIEYFNATTRHDEETFVSFAVLNANNLISQLKSDYLAAKERYITAMGEAMENAKVAQRLEENLMNMDENKLAEEERARCKKMFEDVLEIPKVSAVKVGEGLVNVYTKNIYVHHEKNGTWHDIGTFHIQIGMYNTKYDSTKTVKIMNTKHQISAFNNQMQAPHVFEDGHLCHGNVVATMIDAYRRRDLYQMVLMLVMFLESANLDDAAGEYLGRWPVVSEEVATKSDAEEVKAVELFETQNEEEKTFDEQLDIPIHI